MYPYKLKVYHAYKYVTKRLLNHYDLYKFLLGVFAHHSGDGQKHPNTTLLY